MSSIKQEKNLPGDRGVRREALASPSHSFSLLLYPFILAGKKQLWDQGCQTTLFFSNPAEVQSMGVEKQIICELSFLRVIFIVVHNNECRLCLTGQLKLTGALLCLNNDIIFLIISSPISLSRLQISQMTPAKYCK